jgi:hypothetical protein
VLDASLSLVGADETRAAEWRKHLEDQKILLMEEMKFQKELGEDEHTQYTEILDVCAELRAFLSDHDGA